MSGTGLTRTQYWNVSGNNPTPRSGSTARAESRTDLEGFLLQADAARNAALLAPGVLSGLALSAVHGLTTVTVGPGVASDGDGRILVLAEGGSAITDPLAGAGVQNIPTVPVTATGVSLDTVGHTGDRLVTVTWREVEELVATLLVLHQTPWLRLRDPVTFTPDGLELPLGTVTLDATGEVSGLSATGRVRVSADLAALRLSRTVSGPGPAAGDTAAVELAGAPDGGLQLSLVPAGGPARPVVTVDGGAGDVVLAGSLQVAGALAVQSSLEVTGNLSTTGGLDVAGQLATHADLSVAGSAKVTSGLSVAGPAGIGGGLTVGGPATIAAPTKIQAPLEVGGTVTLGSDLRVQGRTELTGDVHASGHMAADGTLSATGGDFGSLAVHANAVIGAGANGILTVRHVNGKQVNADGPDGLYLNWDTGRTVHVGGGASAADLEVTGSAVVGNRIGVRTASPRFEVEVAGTVCAVTFCNPSDERLKADVVELPDAVQRLSRVRSVTFTARDGTDAGRRRAGVIAQDVRKVLPELVVPMGPGGLLAVDYAGLAGVLVGAVNEMRTRVEALADRVAAMEAVGVPDVTAG